MRVIAGKFRSRQLKSIKGMALRPTSDKLRETLFNILGELVVDSRFVDLFAGTGAVGIEALSRGAREAIFVEKHPPAAAIIKKNLEALEIRKGARVLTSDVLQALRRLAEEPAAAVRSEILFLDPPYADEEQYKNVLSFLSGSSLLAENAVVIAEHQRKLDLPEVFGKLERVRVLRQGDAALTFFRCRPPSLPERPRSE
jgi:16S rRNA (guanine966-N2)-methyltransferase